MDCGKDVGIGRGGAGSVDGGVPRVGSDAWYRAGVSVPKTKLFRGFEQNNLYFFHLDLSQMCFYRIVAFWQYFHIKLVI